MDTLKVNKNKAVARIFTDGACSGNPGVGGWGVVILSHNNVYKFSDSSDNTTNNRMELQAVISGLKFAMKYKLKRVQIYSDSAYVVNAITKGWLHTWKQSGWIKSDGDMVKNAEYWACLYGLIHNDFFKEVEFVKVKGHSGNHFNEMADELAREAVAKRRAIIDGTLN